MIASVFFLMMGIISCVHGHHSGDTHYASCQMKGSGVGGYVLFKETDEQLSAKILVTGVQAAAVVGIHVHQFRPTSDDGQCAGLGGHYNLPDNDGDEGNLGRVTSNDACVLSKTVQVSELALDGNTNIIGRSVQVHLPGHEKACCEIVSSTQDDYEAKINEINNQGSSCS